MGIKLHACAKIETNWLLKEIVFEPFDSIAFFDQACELYMMCAM